MSATVAVLGASARFAASSLWRAGHRVVAADLFADADLAEICPVTQIQNHPTDFADWLERTPCDGWLYTGALENYPDLIDHLATLKPLWGNPGAVLRRVRDPLILQTALRAGNLPCPETRTCDGREAFQGTWLHKTCRGGGGSGVQTAVEFANNPNKEAGYWQEYIHGNCGSAIYLGSSGDCRMLGITEQLVGTNWLHAKAFAYCGSIFPWQLPERPQLQLEAIGRLLVNEFQLQGLFGVDFVFDGHEVWPVEVNPRPTAAVELLEPAKKGELIVAHLDSFTQDSIKLELPVTTNEFSAKAILFAPSEIEITAESSNRMLEAAHRGELADVPRATQTISADAPICTILARLRDKTAIADILQPMVARWERDIYCSNNSP